MQMSSFERASPGHPAVDILKVKVTQQGAELVLCGLQLLVY